MANTIRSQRKRRHLEISLWPTGSHHLKVQEISDSGGKGEAGKLREELKNFAEGGSRIG